MEGTPARGQKLDALAALLIHLSESATLNDLEFRLVRDLSTYLRQGKALVVFSNIDSGELDFDNLQTTDGSSAGATSCALKSYVEEHPEMIRKLHKGEMAGIARLEAGASHVMRHIVLQPIILDAQLAGVVGLELAPDALQHSDEEVELVRQISHHAAPMLSRVRELEVLRRVQNENESLKAILEMQGHFQANVAHELRTPLATVRGYTRMILDGRAGEIPQTQRDFLNTVTENTNRLINLVNWMSHILQYGSQHLKVEVADLAEIWAECLNKNRDALKEKGIHLRQEIPPGRFTTTCDRAKLEYVFNSLLVTAIRRTESGGQITLEFSRGRHREMTVKISDSGENLTSEQINQVFDRYFGPPLSGSSLTDSRLPGIYDIIGLHGGRLFINSRTGEGSTFLFTLPAVRQQDSEENGSDDQALNPGRRRR